MRDAHETARARDARGTDFHREWLHVMDTQHPHTPQETDMPNNQRRHREQMGVLDQIHDTLTEIRDRLPERVEVKVVAPFDPDVIAANLARLKHELETPMRGHGECCDPAPADVDPDEAGGEGGPEPKSELDEVEALAKVLRLTAGRPGFSFPWEAITQEARDEYLNLARAAREHIEAEDAAAHPVGCGQMIRDVRDGNGFSTQIDGVLIAKCDTYGRTKSESVANARAAKAESDLARVTKECDEWQARHAALRGAVVTEPSILGMAASDVEAHGVGFGGLPRSLPATLRGLADALARDNERAES